MGNIPIAKPGRRLNSVRDPRCDHSDSVLVQIDAVEGNKVITIRSPLQVYDPVFAKTMNSEICIL